MPKYDACGMCSGRKRSNAQLCYDCNRMHGHSGRYARTIEEAERDFWSKVQKGVGDTCWPWMGCKRDGYGAFDFRPLKITIAHRFSLWLKEGNLSPGEVVMHICDNPSCVRPSHLRKGTTLENNADAAAKGRSCRGTRQHKHKLQETDALAIFSRCAQGERSVSIARDYGITPEAVSCIKHGKSWSWLTGAKRALCARGTTPGKAANRMTA